MASSSHACGQSQTPLPVFAAPAVEPACRLCNEITAAARDKRDYVSVPVIYMHIA
jgi:hypothetical protein